MYKIFFEPSITQVTANSIIRVDTSNLDSVTELSNWNYDIVDSYENTYYIIPLSKKATIKPKCKLVKNTSRTTDFSYHTNEYTNNTNTTWTIYVTCTPDQESKVLSLLSNTCEMHQCSEVEEETSDYMILSDTMDLEAYDNRQEANEAYKEFKSLLNNL